MVRHFTRVVTSVMVLAVTLASAPSGAAQASVEVEIHKKAELLTNGRAQVEVDVTCAAAEVLEAFIYISQEGFTSQFTPLPVRCDGQTRTESVDVIPLDAPFHKGKARASAYVLLTTGAATSPTRIIQLK